MDDSWSAPSELCTAKPRRLRWTSGGVGTAILVVVIGVIGFGILGAAWDAANRDHRLRDEAKETDAVVTRKWSESTKTKHYNVAYEFSAGGQTLRGKSELPRRNWQTLTAGSHIPVKYVPDEPEISRPSAAYPELLPYWVPAAIAVMWIGMIILAAFPLRKERRLLRYGEPAPGIVTSHPTGRRPKYGYLTKYDFQLPDGRTVQGRTQRDAMFFSGSTVCVLYDPKRPKTNGIYPLRLAKISTDS